MNEYRPVAILGVFQICIIVGGVAITGMHLKLFGYPDNLAYSWNSVSVSTRDWGFLLIAVPVIWAGTIYYLCSKQSADSDTELIALTGWLLCVLLFAFFLYTACDAKTAIHVRYIGPIEEAT